MEATNHLKASLVAAIALANTFGSAWRHGRRSPEPTVTAVQDVLRLTTRQAVGVEVEAYAPGGRRLYDALSCLPAGDVDAAVEVVNALLRSTKAAPQLTRHEDAPWHLHFGDPGVATGWIAEFATATAMLLGSGDVHRLRRCEAARCEDLFLDATRNRSQRFCSTACQNRTKVAAHRARST
ncbi:CGNR zinc finger domain-containing protein [Kribbella turkmenica]|uniref:CGNR zinc finger domain-containing protein n=1 Tax=Kribbella turkmenica TaxID=2530375 RepID=A0A4R4XHB7_9ACTN|nr:CGNR zinc finger domain-containing protein [Kribbella turkmenica]TDD30039.1 CGNR zinc finger domain-containing protein [Kribbella turkmenica]